MKEQTTIPLLLPVPVLNFFLKFWKLRLRQIGYDYYITEKIK